MSKKDDEPLSGDSQALRGSFDLPANGTVPERSLPPGTNFAEAIRNFSGALNDLREIISDLALKQEEAAAPSQPPALEQHYLSLFNGAPGGYLVTDTNGTIQESNKIAAELLQSPQSALTGKRLLAFVAQPDREAFVSLLDLSLLEGEIRELKLQVGPPGAPPLPIILAVAGRRNAAGHLTGFNWLLHSLPPSLQEEEVLKGELAQIKSYFIGLVKVFSIALEMADPYAAGHQQRVAQLSTALAEALGFPAHLIEGLKIAALLHDIGKVAIPSHILTKTGRLSLVEANIMKTHPEMGYDLLKDIEFPWPVAQTVLQHHERWNGSGYPYGFAANDIIIEARILGVADIVEAMLSPRSYRPAVGMVAVQEELRQQRGILYDPQVVDACLKLLVEQGFEFA